MFDAFQGMEWVIIFLIVLLIFGPSKLPQLARGLGQAVYEFRRASRGLVEEEEKPAKTESKPEKPSIDEETLHKLAEKLGINTENKTKDELIKEIVAKLENKETGKEKAVIEVKTPKTG